MPRDLQLNAALIQACIYIQGDGSHGLILTVAMTYLALLRHSPWCLATPQSAMPTHELSIYYDSW